MKKTDYNDLRTDYGKYQIREDEILKNPFKWFDNWLSEAVDSGLPDANAMILSTVSVTGKPSSRVVLLKELSREGMVFFTNYESRKGIEIEENQNVALLFFWASFERQIRIEGKVEKISEDDSAAYFNSRPYKSQVAAVVSHQSKTISSRDDLEFEFEKYIVDEKTIIWPANWGGYRVIPDTFEFWQGRPSRLHDRIRFRREGNNWIYDRLAP